MSVAVVVIVIVVIAVVLLRRKRHQVASLGDFDSFEAEFSSMEGIFLIDDSADFGRTFEEGVFGL